jgi:hypothetical protein
LEEVKHSYHELVKIWHPDRYTTDSKLQQKACEKLKEINLAYEWICKTVGDEPHRQATPPNSPPGGGANRRQAHAAPVDPWVSVHRRRHKHKRHKHRSKTTAFRIVYPGFVLVCFCVLACWISYGWALIPVIFLGLIFLYQLRKSLPSMRDYEMRKSLRSRRVYKNIWK